jgi:hypothetical protein
VAELDFHWVLVGGFVPQESARDVPASRSYLSE